MGSGHGTDKPDMAEHPNRKVHEGRFQVQAPGSFDRNSMAAGDRIYTSESGSYVQRDVGEAGSSSGGWRDHESDEDRDARRLKAAQEAAKNFGITPGQRKTLGGGR